MKKFLLLPLLALICTGTVAMANPNIKKSNLRILYVGGVSDWDKGSFINAENPEEAYQNSVKERMASFEKMLNQYFTDVTVIHADDYSQKMSHSYDVTIMDGKPKEIAPLYQNMEKMMYLKPVYFTEDFDKPILTIGSLGDDLGRRIGTKNDWYCLCLDADAHSWRKDHSIFKGPFDVKMTVVNKPTPEEAFHYAHYSDGEIPTELPMWKVQTKGYSTDEGFSVGLVSRPWGFEDSPEAEIISGGVSTKSVDAVAIARHGNWFHWGFTASPTYLTDEAQAVLANAIVYISKFDGQKIIARKYNEHILTRDNIKELKYFSTKKAYQDIINVQEATSKQIIELGKKAKEKKERGEKLTDLEEYYISYKPAPSPSHETILKTVMPTYFEMFGLDEQAYTKYFDENYDYFYFVQDKVPNKLTLDEDAKSIGISNVDIRLIDEAIKMLETGRDIDKAKRILARYTLVDFNNASEWREWFNKNKNNMFFTQAGGWVWLINSREPGANDYKIWEERRALVSIQPEETSTINPVVVNATLATLQSGEKAVYVTVKIQPGYHIYNRVASSDPYIPTKIEVTLPNGYKKVAQLQGPMGRPYNSKGTTIIENSAVFSQIIEGSGEGSIECTVEYQSCDSHVCFPPVEKSFSFKVE